MDHLKNQLNGYHGRLRRQLSIPHLPSERLLLIGSPFTLSNVLQRLEYMHGTVFQSFPLAP